tara:strand:+ start:88 stop:750 length:663 start_codon:yes stop_codon:yes gene_type:complete
MRRFGLGDKVIYKGSPFTVCGSVDPSLREGATVYRVSQTSHVNSSREVHEHELTWNGVAEAIVKPIPAPDSVAWPNNAPASVLTTKDVYRELGIKNIELHAEAAVLSNQNLKLVNRNDVLTKRLEAVQFQFDQLSNQNLRLIENNEKLTATVRRANPVKEPVAPVVYMIGQRVILNNFEIGTVSKSQHDYPEGLWVYSPSKEFSSCYAHHNIKPLPNGQL